MEMDCKLQIIMLGESVVGKTSLLHRFKLGTFKEKLPMTTVAHSEETVTVRDKKVQLKIWDTSGRKSLFLNKLIRNYYSLVDGVLLVYDVRNDDTFSKLSEWLKDFKSTNEKAEVLIAGNKIEDPSERSVDDSTIKTFTENENLEHLGVSAKSGENVREVFCRLVEKILTARGILPCSKDPLPTETKYEEMVSPVDWNQSGTLDVRNNSSTENVLPDVVPELFEFHPESDTRVKAVQASENLLSKNTVEEFHPTNPDVQCDVDIISWSSDDSFHSAQCALEFFQALGEDVMVPESNN